MIYLVFEPRCSARPQAAPPRTARREHKYRDGSLRSRLTGRFAPFSAPQKFPISKTASSTRSSKPILCWLVSISSETPYPREKPPDCVGVGNLQFFPKCAVCYHFHRHPLRGTHVWGRRSCKPVGWVNRSQTQISGQSMKKGFREFDDKTDFG